VALIDLSSRTIRARIVYYGPGLGGKTTNLRTIHRLQGGAAPFVSIAGTGDRTLFFDSLPIDIDDVLGWRLRFDLYTVPGQDAYERTRLAVLNGADGVVFVADARVERLEENRRSLDELRRQLARQGKPIESFPLILQYNKMDLPDALAAPEIDRLLEAGSAPRFEAAAVAGRGVVETLRAACKLVTASL